MYNMFTNKDKYKDLSINTGEKHEFYCNVYTLDRIKQLFDHMLDRHSKVLFMRCDFTYPDGEVYPSTNKLFIDFMANFIKNRNRKPRQFDCHYMWVREKDESQNYHYNCILLMDASKTQSIYKHIEKMKDLWSRTLTSYKKKQLRDQGLPDNIPLVNVSGLIDRCDRYTPGLIISRGDFEALDYAFYWASYLAKQNDKVRDKGIDNMGMSELQTKGITQ